MRVATVDGLVTLFYDGSKQIYNRELCDEASDLHSFDGDNLEEFDLSDECKRYWKERLSWQQVIIEKGVTVIPKEAFYKCYNIKRVIFSNTVIRIEEYAFTGCNSLISANLPINLEHVGMYGFCGYDLISVFVPPRCRSI